MDLFNVMGKVKEMQSKMKEVQENLTGILAEGEAGAGLVKATVNGKKQVLKVEIDDSLVKLEDKEMLQDLVVAAVNKALANVEEKSSEFMKKSTEGILPNIPGFDLSSLMK